MKMLIDFRTAGDAKARVNIMVVLWELLLEDAGNGCESPLCAQYFCGSL